MKNKSIEEQEINLNANDKGWTFEQVQKCKTVKVWLFESEIGKMSKLKCERENFCVKVFYRRKVELCSQIRNSKRSLLQDWTHKYENESMQVKVWMFESEKWKCQSENV